jgi:murein L,D-transpeptidase YcbB/YkuD
LAGQDGWNREKIDQTIASGKTKTIKLKKPMRIVIAYGTASIVDGRLSFRKDIYKRDPVLLKALDGPFRVRKQDL